MQLGDVMIRDVESICESETGERAWETMRERGLAHLVVLDERRRVTGVVSAHDLGRQGGDRRRSRRVTDLMTVSPVTASPAASLGEAAQKLRGFAFGGYLPIVEDEQPVGIVTVSGLRQAMAQGEEPRPRRRRRATGTRPPRAKPR
jgi:CBS domain-containing protein